MKETDMKICRQFDVEDEKIASSTRLFHQYKYDIILEMPGKTKRKVLLWKCLIRDPFYTDDILPTLIDKHYSIALENVLNNEMRLLGDWGLNLKDLIEGVVSENGRLISVCQELGEKIILLTYEDYFSNNRYGRPHAMKLFGNQKRCIQYPFRHKFLDLLKSLVLCSVDKICPSWFWSVI